MNVDELRAGGDGYAVGYSQMQRRPVVVVVAEGAIYGAVNEAAPVLLDDPSLYEPYTRLVPEGTSDFIVDIDTAIGHEQAETVDGSIVSAYLVIIGYMVPGAREPEYRLTYPDGQPYDRNLGLIRVGGRILEGGTISWESPA